jgi:lipid-A-disaccharide synthase
VAEQLATEVERAAFAGDGPLLLALPGSRQGEVRRLAPVLGAVLGLLRARHPGLRVVLPTLPTVEPLVREVTAEWPVAPEIVLDPARKRGAFAAADVALAASGTVSLELAANGCPMVIAYRLHPVSFWLMKRAALIDTVTLVNLVSETRAVPEFLGPACLAENIAPAVLALLAQGPERAAQEAAMRLTMERLGKGGEPPGLRAARSVLSVL